jgi:hypothetical protein
MNVAQSVAEILRDHRLLEVEGIDRTFRPAVLTRKVWGGTGPRRAPSRSRSSTATSARQARLASLPRLASGP